MVAAATTVEVGTTAATTGEALATVTSLMTLVAAVTSTMTGVFFDQVEPQVFGCQWRSDDDSNSSHHCRRPLNLFLMTATHHHHPCLRTASRNFSITSIPHCNVVHLSFNDITVQRNRCWVKSDEGVYTSSVDRFNMRHKSSHS